MSQKYLEQYERMKRWYYRVKNSEDRMKDPESWGFPGPLESDSRQDDCYYAFFIACHHLGDWLKESGVDVSIIDEYISRSDYLKICVDLSNYLKHAKLDPDRKVKFSYDTKGKSQGLVRFGQGMNPDIAFYDLIIEIDGKVYNSLELTKGCVKEWNKFLNKNSLPIPELFEERMYQNFKDDEVSL